MMTEREFEVFIDLHDGLRRKFEACRHAATCPAERDGFDELLCSAGVVTVASIRSPGPDTFPTSRIRTNTIRFFVGPVLLTLGDQNPPTSPRSRRVVATVYASTVVGISGVLLPAAGEHRDPLHARRPPARPASPVASAARLGRPCLDGGCGGRK